MQAQKLQLDIKSERPLEVEKIDSIGYRKTHSDFASIQKEIDSFSRRLERLGYFDHKLNSLKKEKDTIYIADFELNQPVRLIRISDKNGLLTPEILKKMNLELDNGSLLIETRQLEDFLKSLNRHIANQGQPFSFLQLRNYSKVDDQTVEAELFSNETVKRTIDKIVIKGYDKFPKVYLKRHLKLRTGQTFSLNTIERKTQRLKNLRFAKELRSPEVLFTPDSTTLYIYVEKVKQNVFDGFLGFGTNEDSNKLQFDGYLNLALQNNLNYGETFELYYKSDENEQQTFDVNLSMPYLFGSPLGASVNLNIFKRDSTFLTVQQSAHLNYQISPKLQIGAGINSTTSSNLLDNDLSGIEDFDAILFTGTLNFRDVDVEQPLFPISQSLSLLVGVGARNTDNGDDDQLRLGFQGSKIFYLDNRNSIFTRVTSQYLDSERYLENELPRFGGINSIRGFEENTLIANIFGVLNTEYRYQASSSLYVHSVIDAAYFENQLADQKSKLFGFGFGFGLLTNAGLLKLTYATAKTEGQKLMINDSKVHLSLTARF